jgi:hypothetical protein
VSIFTPGLLIFEAGTPGTLSIGGWMDPVVILDALEERETFCPYPESVPDSSAVQHLASSIHRSIYHSPSSNATEP